MLWAGALAAIVLRALYVLNHQTDSDEPQHLHVVWGWTHGLVQYRDLFDNHAPLFHLLMAPFVALLGERAEIVTLARLLMLPLVALAVWATYLLGRALWSARVGRWAAVLTALAPGFLVTSVEFRADDLWMVAWLFALVAFFRGELTPRRALVGGLMLGLALATSLKSILLILALAMAGMIALAMSRRHCDRFAPRHGWRALGWTAAGLAAAPAMIVLVMWRLGALDAMFHCTIGHNVLPGLGLWRNASSRMLIFPAALAILLPVAAFMLRRLPRSERRMPQVVLMLTTGLYFAMLEAFWPLITAEDFLPSTPMLLVLATAAVSSMLTRLERSRAWLGRMRWIPAAAALVVVLDVTLAVRREPAWIDHDLEQKQLLSDVLKATRPGESIMDLKGETVFRPRPSYLILEGVTKARLDRGLIADHIAAEIVRARTHFVGPDNVFFPPAARRFLNEHFVSLGTLRVLGAMLGGARAPEVGEWFDVSFPERFALIADGNWARGLLDGLPFRQPVLLSAGPHVYRAHPGERHIELIWEEALDRGLVAGPALRAAR